MNGNTRNFRMKTSVGVALTMALACSAPALAADIYGANATRVSIPDNNTAWTAVSVIPIAGAPAGAVVSAIDVHIEVVHPYVGDLNVVLSDQDATPVVSLWGQEGGSADNISKTWTGVTNFNGQPVNQNWALWARDLAAGDGGYISSWWIRVYYTATTGPVTVQGTVMFSNRTYGDAGWVGRENRAARYVTVEVLSTASGLLGSTWTDATGRFSTSVSSLSVGQSFTVRVKAETEAVIVGPAGQTAA